MPGSPPPAPLARLATPITVRVGPVLAGAKVVEGSESASMHSPAGKRVGKSLRAKVVIYAFKAGQWLRGQVDERNQKEEVQENAKREQWRLRMARDVWKEMLATELRLIAGNAFDQLAGGKASNGVVPVLTSDARTGSGTPTVTG